MRNYKKIKLEDIDWKSNAKNYQNKLKEKINKKRSFFKESDKGKKLI